MKNNKKKIRSLLRIIRNFIKVWMKIKSKMLTRMNKIFKLQEKIKILIELIHKKKLRYVKFQKIMDIFLNQNFFNLI